MFLISFFLFYLFLFVFVFVLAFLFLGVFLCGVGGVGLYLIFKTQQTRHFIKFSANIICLVQNTSEKKSHLRLNNTSTQNG